MRVSEQRSEQLRDSEYVDHYNKERPHKGLDYRRPIEPEQPPPQQGTVQCRSRLGGLLRSDYRVAV
jgi:hypothetical protein